MTIDFKKKWIIIGAAWLSVILITQLNVSLKNQIIEAKERKILLRLDEQFLKDHLEDIAEIQKKEEKFNHNIESLKFGLLSIESELKLLAAKHGMQSFKMNSQPGHSSDEPMPVIFSGKGYLKDLVDCLNVLQKDYGYLPVKKVTVEIEEPKSSADFKIFLNYRYKIVSLGN